MINDPLASQTHEELLNRTLRTVQNPLYNQDPSSFSTFASLLRHTRFFRTRLEPPANLHDFVHLAKVRLDYEVHPYGTILMKENDHAEKLYIVIKGNALKLQQRDYKEIEQEAKLKRVSKNSIENLDNDPFPLPIASKGKETSFKISLTPKKGRSKMLLRTNTSSIFQTEVSSHNKSEDFGLINNKILHKGLLEPENFEMRILKARRDGLKIPSRPSIDNIEDNNEEEESSFPTTIEDFGVGNNNNRKEFKARVPVRPTEGKEVKFRAGILKARRDFSEKKLHNEKENDALLDEQDEVEEDEEELDLEDDEEKIERKKRQEEAEKERKLKAEAKFIKYLAKKHPKLRVNLFLADIVKVYGARTYNPGDSFGENFYKSQPPRENSIIAVSSEDIHLLVLTRKNYFLIMEKIVQQSYEKANFFTRLFPSFDKATIEKISYHFSKDHFRKDEVIYRQGDLAQKLYVVEEGDVRLSKEVKGLTRKNMMNINATHKPTIMNIATHKHPDSIELPITSITKNQFFGEELLLKKELRQYTAIAKSQDTVVYFIAQEALHKLRENYGGFLDNLKEQTREKFDWREKRTLDLLEQHIKGMTRGQGQMGPENTSLSRVVSTETSIGSHNHNNNNKPYILFTDFGEDYSQVEEEPNALFLSRSVQNKPQLTPRSEVSMINRNLKTYKEKYSRKVEKHHEVSMSKDRSQETSLERERSSNAVIPDEFNIRKELELLSPKKQKLPFLSFSGNKHGIVPKSPQTTKSISKGKIDFSSYVAEHNTKESGGKAIAIPAISMEMYQSLTLTPRGSSEQKKPKFRRLLQPTNQGASSSEYGFPVGKKESSPSSKSQSVSRMPKNMIHFNDARMEQYFKSKKGCVKGLKLKLNEICRQRVKKEKNNSDCLMFNNNKAI